MAVAVLDEDLARSLGLTYAASWRPDVREILLAPSGFGTRYTLADAYQMLSDRGIELPGFLIPLCVVDEGSLACVVSQESGDYMTGEIVRVHLAEVDARYQCAPLDVHPLAYLSSLEQELAARQDGLRRVLDWIGPATRRRTWPRTSAPVTSSSGRSGSPART